ncbi:MAG TPA: alpha/beta hydrolase [Baekduia sp.]|nr:alpha/beta hydrolase [Baekduia sp.]
MLPWNQADAYGFREGVVEASAYRVRYWEKVGGAEGERPLLTVHGGGGTEVGLAHDLIAADRRVICFEVPGFGEERDRVPQDSEELAHVLAGAAEGLGIPEYSVMGTSMGGVSALWWASLYRDAVKAVVLEAPAAFRIRDPDPALGEDPVAFQRAFHAQPQRKPWASEIAAPPNPELLVTLMGPMRDARLEEAVKALRSPIAAEDSGDADNPFSDRGEAPPKTPVLILWGTEDGVLPKDQGREVLAAMPHGHLIYVYDAAHDLKGDRPEAFAGVVRDFLTYGDRFVVRHEPTLVNP